MASGSLSLEGVSAACDSLGRIARVLADETSVALIVGGDGTLSFTSLATRSISESHHPHPLQKMIVRACQAHHARTGGDCKAILTLLGETTRQVARLGRDLGDACTRQTLLTELPHFEALLPELFRGVWETVGTVADDPSVFVDSVVESRSRTLSGIVCEFVRRSVKDWKFAPEAVSYFVDHFEDLCSKAVTPVDQSSVLKGFVINSDCPRRGDNVRFVVVWAMSVKTDDVVWVDSASLSRIWPRIEVTLNGLKNREISVILSPSAAPSRLHSCCSRLGICLIDRISTGDLQNILFFTGVNPLDTLHDSVSADSVSCFDSMRPIVFGGTQFLHLETSVSMRPFLPCHVVLCAPSSVLWKERYSEFHDCLKVLRQWLRPSDLPQLLDLNPRACSFPLGLWELELKLVLPKAERSCPNLCRILDSALLTFACSTWGIPVCRYRGRDSYEEFARTNSAKGFEPVVPATTVESVLLEVLQLLRQLLRIDAVVGSKDALKGSNLGLRM